ncbi:MAG: DUF5682 family protein, partial [Planctomycetota bacterium]|nr:DUF5682 family protein [Planctomycetota bacterium]
MFIESGTTDRLLNCTAPHLIGVRHHSAAMSRVIPQLLDDYRPNCVLIELPMEFTAWLEWLGHEELEAPVALAGCSENAFDLSFYPFADFSPELAALRWAIRNEVRVEPCDLPLADRAHGRDRTHAGCEPSGLLERILRRTQTSSVGNLWERMVETPSAGSSADAVRRSGLLFGWALRSNDQIASNYDRRREAHMRECIDRTIGRCAVVVGAYHAAALLPEPVLWSPPDDELDDGPDTPTRKASRGTAKQPEAARKIATALIPYSFEQFDERSGYPAGIRDPFWHQRVFEAVDHADMQHAVADLTVGVCRELRVAGHPINVADGKEVVRMSLDLARLRGIAVPGRGELIEALQMCLARGEVMGIGRAVAKAMESVLVGTRRGSLPPDTPRSGLAPHVESLLQQLNLPGPTTLGEKKQLRLDPLRSRLDRARVVTFERLSACGVPYASPVEPEQGLSRENLTEVWDVEWQHATAAMIELSSARGATLRQATSGALHAAGLNADVEDWTVEQLVPLMTAARCGLPEVVEDGLDWLMGSFTLTAGLPELTRGMEFVERLRAGHVPGLPPAVADEFQPHVQSFALPVGVHTTPLLQAAISRVEGLVGSEDMADVAALLDLVLWFQQQDDNNLVLDASQLKWAVRALANDGSPLMQGAGEAALLLLDESDADQFGRRLSGWIDGAVNRESRLRLVKRISAAVFLAAPRLDTDLGCLDEPERLIDRYDDAVFLARLPPLRGGFDVFSPVARERLLASLLARLPDEGKRTHQPHDDPKLAALRFEADEDGRRALSELMPDLVLEKDVPAADVLPERIAVARPGRQLSLPDRWRLILGAQQERLAGGSCGWNAARALDELYGAGRGEGQRRGLSGRGGGQEAAYPGVREWAEELQQLFGEDVREEVLGEAVAAGRTAALTMLAGETVTPSIELLESVLSMKGALPESQMDHLRRIAKKIVDELTRELATRLRPALMGLSTPRPSRRPTPRLDLARTVRANLHTARLNADGKHQLVPDRLIFRGASKRSMDWHLIFVVDVSGSMEPSVIYSAMMAAILSGLPAISVQFLAFSTEVIDFTDRVDDPLAMLLEVEVGGGTHIAKGLRAARERLRVPSRSIVLTVSDFEEGWPVS